MRKALFASALVPVIVVSVAAEDKVRPTEVKVVPNFHAASVYAFFDGDANKNATVRMAYRAGGAAEWREGHPLSRTGPSKSYKGGRFAGSIFYLEPDEPLEVRVTFDDPDGLADEAAGRLTAWTRTRSDEFPAGSGKTYYVGHDGDDANPGTEEKPFKTIQHAVDLVEPADVIHVLFAEPFESVAIPGTGLTTVQRGVQLKEHFESVTIKKSGRSDAYITLRGTQLECVLAPAWEAATQGGGPPVEFTTQTLLAGYVTAEGGWRHIGGRLWSIDEKRRVGTVTFGRLRLYHHGSLDELKEATAPLLPGWWQDDKAGKVYLRLKEGDVTPDAYMVRLGVLPFGLRFENASHWIVENLDFEVFGGGPYSRGIEVSGGSDIVVRNCWFSTMRTGVRIRNRAERVLVERCHFRDTSIFDWPWKACKSHDVEGSAVSLAAGPGCVVRHNTIRGWFNGIAPATWGDLHNDAVNSDMDIHHNTFTEMGDDPMEPEGSCMNVRFWHNETFNTLQGISIAPVTVGPCYVVRDRYVNFKQGAVKVSVDSAGVVFLYHVLGFQNRPDRVATSVCGPWDNMHFRNSILRGTRYAIEDAQKHPIGCSFDYCCLSNTRDGPLAKWSGKRYAELADLPRDAGFGPHNVRVEPYTAIANERPKDLADGLIDAGVRIPGINDDFKGKAPDIGPDEVR